MSCFKKTKKIEKKNKYRISKSRGEAFLLLNIIRGFLLHTTEEDKKQHIKIVLMPQRKFEIGCLYRCFEQNLA